jgi:hypothetical protein
MAIRSFLAGLAVLATLAARPVLANDGLLLAACTLAPAPSEQGLVAFSMQPGSTIVIFGANFFGPVDGQILIHLKDYMGNPLVLPLAINFWSDSSVGGNIPPAPPAGSFPPGGSPSPPPGGTLLPTIYGVQGQTATFEVVTWCGKSTTASGPLLSAAFTPFMDIEPLPWIFITCSRTSNHSGDGCQGQGGDNWPSECEWPAPGLAPVGSGPEPASTIGFFGHHYSGWGGGNHGTDSFVANVFNDWSVEAITGYSVDPMNVDGSPDNSSGMWANLSFAPSPQNSWTVQWRQDACSLLVYSGLVSITGPIGVPHGWIIITSP